MHGGLEKMSEAIRNWGRWSDTAAVMLPDILFGVITFELILLVKVLELFLIFAGCTIWGRSIWEERESRNLLVGEWFNKSI